MLWCASASTFVIVSPTDYQNILAELRSPAALHSDTPFLEAELPVTPSLFPGHRQDCLHVKTASPLLSGPQPLPWSPETQPSSRDHDSPPRSPPRPRELVLCVRVPDPVPPKVRKPHIALNDQLLLSEEEDRFYQDLELSCRPKAQALLAACEFDTDMVASTSSPSLTSLSSITPSSPERPHRQTCVLDGRQEVAGSLESEKDVKMVAGMVAMELEGKVEKWLKPDWIQNVDRKCEMIMKGGGEGTEAEATVLLQQGEGSLEEEGVVVEMKEAGWDVELRDVQARPGQGRAFRSKTEPQTVPESIQPAAEGEGFEGDSEENIRQGGKMDAADENMQLEDKGGLAGSQSDVWLTSGGDVDHHRETGSSEEEEEGDAELPGGFLLEKEGGTEEKKELGGASRVRLEQTHKEMLSIVGWHSDSSSVNVEPPTPGRSVSSDLLDRRER